MAKEKPLMCPLRQLKEECFHTMAKRHDVEVAKRCPLWIEDRCGLTVAIINLKYMADARRPAVERIRRELASRDHQPEIHR